MRNAFAWQRLGMTIALMVMMTVACGSPDISAPTAEVQKLFEAWATQVGVPYDDVSYVPLNDDGTFATVRVQATLRESAQDEWQEKQTDVECRKVGGQWQCSPNFTSLLTGAEQEQQNTITVEVFADQDWQDTAFYVQEGQTVTIEYLSGQWATWPGINLDGQGCLDTRFCSQDPNHPTNIFSFKHGGLIGRVEQQMFAVGNAVTLRAPSSGSVFLRINDVNITDNSGALMVRLSIENASR